MRHVNIPSLLFPDTVVGGLLYQTIPSIVVLLPYMQSTRSLQLEVPTWRSVVRKIDLLPAKFLRDLYCASSTHDRPTYRL